MFRKLLRIHILFRTLNDPYISREIGNYIYQHNSSFTFLKYQMAKTMFVNIIEILS